MDDLEVVGGHGDFDDERHGRSREQRDADVEAQSLASSTRRAGLGLTLASVLTLLVGLVVGAAVRDPGVVTPPTQTETVVVLDVAPADPVLPDGSASFDQAPAGLLQGMKWVGAEVQPGSYRGAPAVAGSECHWARFGKDGVVLELVSAIGATRTTITPSDTAFFSMGCSWAHVP